MAEAGYNESPVVLPSLFGSPGAALQQSFMIQRENQQQQQADEWRKLSMIRQYTDPKDYPTGEDVAKGVVNKELEKVAVKYSNLAASLSPAQLQENLIKDTRNVLSQAEAMNTEMKLHDEKIKTIKQMYPDADIKRISDDDRIDILSRRLSDDKTELRPLIDVKPTQLDFTNPEIMSFYIKGNKKLRDYILNTKGESRQVLQGSRDSYTHYSGNIPWYKKMNITEKDFDETGFYKGKITPSFSIKGKKLSPDEFKRNNTSTNVVDEDVYEGFIGSNSQIEPEIVNLAKERYKDYDVFSPTEKNIAKRSVLYDVIESTDMNQLQATSATKPPRSTTNIYQGGRGGSDIGGNWVKRATSAVVANDFNKVNDVFGELFKGGIDMYKGIEENPSNPEELIVRFNPKKGSKTDALLKLFMKKEGIDVEEDEPGVFTFNKKDPQLSNKLAGLYQYIMGANKKMEDEQYPVLNTQPTKKETSKKDPFGLGL